MKKNLKYAGVFLAVFLLLSPFTACKKDGKTVGENLDGSANFLTESETSTSETGEEAKPTLTLPKDVAEEKPIQRKATYAQTSTTVNLRTGAGTEFSVLGSAEKGNIYAVFGETNGWIETRYRGRKAYFSKNYATLFSLDKSENEKTEKVIEKGYALLGTPYVFGAVRYHDGKGNRLSGFTSEKFDCSSLTQYIYYHGASVLLGTTTREQVRQGTFVKKSDLKRGDCIYFTNASRYQNTGIERVGHVAVYLGNGYILHTSSDYARIEKMTSSRWNYYIETRRFL